jgi:hypothetical protein
MAKRRKRISAKMAVRHAKWGHQIYKQLRLVDGGLAIDVLWFVDVPPRRRDRDRS